MSQIIDSVRMALRSIWTNKLRSFLTVLGNIVAVTSIVTVVSLIQGLDAALSNTIAGAAGSDTFTIERLPAVLTSDDEERTRAFPMLTLEEAEAVQHFSPTIAAIVARTSQRGPVSFRGREVQNAEILGVTSAYAEFSTFTAERGRLMTHVEVERGQPVALLGWDVADELFGEDDPIDADVVIGGTRFRVAGVSAKKGFSFAGSQDAFVVIPLSAHMRIFGQRPPLSFMVKPVTPDALPQAVEDATLALRVARQLRPAERDTFGVFTSGTGVSIFQQAARGIFAVLIGVVSLSLLVSGIVIMNIMLMVVSERTREIGLRKALGAKRRDILSQILTEAVTISTAGGIIGVALGFVAARLIAYFSPLPAVLELWSVVLGIGITAGVGLFFGLYPAARAANLDPIEALRRE